MAKPVLYIDGEALDMGGLPSITIERHNPLLSEGQQSYSYPFTIPCTPHNDRLLGFPRRYARAAMGNHSWKCTLVCGSRQRVGRLMLNSMDATSYDCSMIYDTAQLLDKTKGKQLAEIFVNEQGQQSISNQYPFNNINSALAYLQRLYTRQETSAMFSVFTVLLNVEEYTFTHGNGEERKWHWKSFLNLPDANNILTDRQMVLEDGVPTLPTKRGFGVAPFFRAKFLIEFIFKTREGYKLDWGNRAENPIDKLVVLHNRMDALVQNGNLKYRQLCPDCTVDEFIATIEGMFCGKFVLNSLTNTVTFRFFNDELDYEGARLAVPNSYPLYPDTRLNGSFKQPKLELMPYSLVPPKLEFKPKSAIKLTVKRNMSLPDSAGFEEGKLFLDVLAEELIHYQAVQGGASVDINLHCELLKDRKRNNLSMCFFSTNSIDHNIRSSTIALAYLFGTSYVNSVVVDNEETVKEDKMVKTPLAFACELFNSSYFVGIVDGYYKNNINTMERTMSLRLHDIDGLFNVYYYLRDQMLRSGGYHITLPIDTALQVDENELYLLNGQKVLVEKVTETLGENERQEVRLQTIKNYT